MNRRFGECALVLSALSGFVTTTAFTVPPDRKVEALAAGVLAIPVVMALFIEPFVRLSVRSRLGVALAIVGLALARHWLFYCPSPFFTIISFSLVFSLGQAACALSVLELYLRDRHGNLFLALYSFLTMAAASYTAATDYFLPFMVVYFALFTQVSRVTTCARSELSFAMWQVALVVLIALSLGTAVILVRYRDEINNWTPATPLSSSSSGFSPITRLGSKDIETSRESVLRYFAPQGSYHLRGKVFDRYEQGGWYLSDERLAPAPEETGEIGMSSVTLLYLRPESVIFAPLNYRPAGTTPIDSEGIVHVVEEAGACVALYPTPSVVLEQDRCRYTQLPETTAAYFRELAQHIAGDKTTAQDQVKAFLLYLSDYPYRRQMVVEAGEDPIVSFLRKREGAHCEMFASALVMLARAQGIPARYAAGYYAHEWNDLGQFATIRACDAHAWAEVLLPEGWTTVDPTPPEALREELLGYRGIFEDYREFIAEKVRRLRSSAITLLTSRRMWVMSLLAGGCALFLLWRRRSPATTRKAADMTAQPPALVRLQKLSREFTADMGYLIPPRRQAETLREYYRRAEIKLSLCRPDASVFARNLYASLEEGIYGDRLPGSEELDYLESQWRQLAITHRSQGKR